MDDQDLRRLVTGLRDGSLRVQLDEESAANAIAGTLAAATDGARARAAAIARGERDVFVYRAGETAHTEVLGATTEQVLQLRNAGATDR